MRFSRGTSLHTDILSPSKCSRIPSFTAGIITSSLHSSHQHQSLPSCPLPSWHHPFPTSQPIIHSFTKSSSPRLSSTRTHAIQSIHSDSPNNDSPLPSSHTKTIALSLLTTCSRVAHFITALYKFTRPHTILGTLISVISVSLLAITNTPLAGHVASSATLNTVFTHSILMHSFASVPMQAWFSLWQAISSALLMNVSIVGINQLYDIDIDRINKPYLPLAAGDFSPATGFLIAASTGILSLAIGVASGSMPLLCTLGGSLLLGIVYSTDLPLLRWKRNPIAAATCILAVRAVLVQLGFFLHMQLALGCTVVTLTRPVIFATCFMFAFSIVIALFKDIPDVSGDEHAGVRTLSVRLGQKNVFWMCIALLDVAYMGAVCVALGSEHLLSRIVGASTHCVMGLWVWWRAYKTDVTSSASIYRCYMDVWKAFYIEYLLLPWMK